MPIITEHVVTKMYTIVCTQYIISCTTGSLIANRELFSTDYPSNFFRIFRNSLYKKNFDPRKMTEKNLEFFTYGLVSTVISLQLSLYLINIYEYN